MNAIRRAFNVPRQNHSARIINKLNAKVSLLESLLRVERQRTTELEAQLKMQSDFARAKQLVAADDREGLRVMASEHIHERAERAAARIPK